MSSALWTAHYHNIKSTFLIKHAHIRDNRNIIPHSLQQFWASFILGIKTSQINFFLRVFFYSRIVFIFFYIFWIYYLPRAVFDGSISTETHQLSQITSNHAVKYILVFPPFLFLVNAIITCIWQLAIRNALSNEDRHQTPLNNYPSLKWTVFPRVSRILLRRGKCQNEGGFSIVKIYLQRGKSFRKCISLLRERRLKDVKKIFILSSFRDVVYAMLFVWNKKGHKKLKI